MLNSPLILAGEELAWEGLSSLDPEEVCRRAGVIYNCKSQTFKLKFFSQYVDVSLPNQTISGQIRESKSLLERLPNYSVLAILGYLIHVSETVASGKLVNPADLTGGQIYTGGTHVLPMQLVAGKYGANRTGFLSAGRRLGGQELSLAEASLLIHPFPRIEVAILLWLKDDEFPARSVLLVDASSQQQLPPDALWLTAMMCLSAML